MATSCLPACLWSKLQSSLGGRSSFVVCPDFWQEEKSFEVEDYLKNPLGDLLLTLREKSGAAKLSNDSHPSPQSALPPLKLRILLFNPMGVVVFLFLPREKTRARKVKEQLSISLLGKTKISAVSSPKNPSEYYFAKKRRETCFYEHMWTHVADFPKFVRRYLGNAQRDGEQGHRYPVVQWLRLHSFTAEGSGSIPVRVAEIPQDGKCPRKKKNLKKGAEGAVFSELLECCLLGSESLTFPAHKVTVLSDFKKGRAERRSLGYFLSCSLHPNNRCTMLHGWSR